MPITTSHLTSKGHIFQEDEVIGKRFVVKRLIAHGSFSQCYEVLDQMDGKRRQLKVCTQTTQSEQARAEREARLIKDLSTKDLDHHRVVKYINHLNVLGHVCVATELTTCTLGSFLTQQYPCGKELRPMQGLAKALLSSLQLLKENGVIHANLQLNKFFLKPSLRRWSVADFSMAEYVPEGQRKIYTSMQPMQYRPPETLLGLQSDFAIDMWSVGVILLRAFLGEFPFTPMDDIHYMTVLVEMLGRPPDDILVAAKHTARFLSVYRALTLRLTSGQPLKSLLLTTADRRTHGKEVAQIEESEVMVLYDLIQRMLDWDPVKRIKPEEALRHKFCTMCLRFTA